ncbi:MULTISPECIES: hypothetical protein [unclassified Bradyrhizobium]|uniref:hypothetical protein n=1 Tax=unclassified Bradyrhizobium TaxID=2631580 RepID=UPI002915DC0D|nr:MULTISPECIES: hypothetical protein [unclassified Bradyrhizobium]
MPTRDISRDVIRDVASTLAHHWIGPDRMDSIGVERIIKSYPHTMRPVICALIILQLERQGFYTQAAAFEGLLFDLADIAQDAREA